MEDACVGLLNQASVHGTSSKVQVTQWGDRAEHGGLAAQSKSEWST